MNILTIMGMVVATMAVTLLCIAMTKTPIDKGKVYHTTDDGSPAHNRGKLPEVTIPPDTTVELNATDNSINGNQQGMWSSLPGSTPTVTENQTLTNYSSFKYLQQENRRSLLDIGLVQADSFIVRSPTSKSVVRPIDLQNASININSHNRNGNYTTNMDDNSANNSKGVTENTKKYQINGRQSSQRKINHSHKMNKNTPKYATVAEENSSDGYQNGYDLTYNVDDYGYKEYDNPAYEIGWTSASRPEQTHPGSLWSSSSGSWEPPPYGTDEEYLADQGPSRKPLDGPSSNPTQYYQNLLPKLENINWKTIGMLALLKLGLAKLQTIGFLNTLFLLGFSFKLYMIAVFFKFLMIMKLMKFFKILLLPMFLTRLLPTFIQLLMMPGRLLDLLRRLTDNNVMPTSQPGGLLPSQPGGLLPSRPGELLPSQPSGLLPSQPSGLLPSRPGGLIPNRPSGLIPNRPGGLAPNRPGGLIPNRPGGLAPNQPGGLIPNRPGGLAPNQPGGLIPNRPAAATLDDTQRGGMVRTTGDIPISESTTGNYNIVSKPNDSLFKLEDTNLTNVQIDESMQLSDPTLEIFQKLLDSEKCVERIACRISVAEKKGIVPIWINWVLHRIQKLIPNDKLESYLKAYKDVNDEINAKSSVSDNWIAWCLERYNCNSSDNTTNMSNAAQ